MVVEKLFSEKWVERTPFYSLLLGVIFSLVAFGTSYLLFQSSSVKHFIGVSTILFIVVIAIPGVVRLFALEERIEVKIKRSFFKQHEGIIDFYIYFFIGVFLVLFFIAMIDPSLVFSQDQLYGIKSQAPSFGDGKNLPPPVFEVSSTSEILRIFKNNVYVMLISFVLSLFYGSGALFLITLNASIFASALARVVKASIGGLGIWESIVQVFCHLSVMFLHTIPELASYFLAAIAGGVLSKALIKEQFMSEGFKRVFDDGIALLFLSLLVVAIAAVIEVLVSKKLFWTNACNNWVYPSAFLAVLVIGIIVYLEFHRKRRIK